VQEPPVSSQTITGQASVIDGDTIEIHGTRIRLHGIDAPESGQACTTQGKTYRCGQQAAFALADKIKGGAVECRKKDLDQYGRIVARCSVRDEDINGWMVAQGWALAYRQYSMDYVGQEARAKNLKLGIWQGEFEVPSDWRRNHPGRTSTRELNPSTDRPAKPRQAVYYRPGDTFGKRFPSLDGCNQARERDGNIGVCVMK
jgi:endonuclease YncB( thermonuclease family)